MNVRMRSPFKAARNAYQSLFSDGGEAGASFSFVGPDLFLLRFLPQGIVPLR